LRQQVRGTVAFGVVEVEVVATTEGWEVARGGEDECRL